MQKKNNIKIFSSHGNCEITWTKVIEDLVSNQNEKCIYIFCILWIGLIKWCCLSYGELQSWKSCFPKTQWLHISIEDFVMILFLNVQWLVLFINKWKVTLGICWYSSQNYWHFDRAWNCFHLEWSNIHESDELISWGSFALNILLLIWYFNSLRRWILFTTLKCESPCCYLDLVLGNGLHEWFAWWFLEG